MKFILIADKNEHKKTSAFFFLNEVFIFVVLVIGILYILYPRDLLQKVLAQDKPSAVTLSYLQSFSKNNQQNQPLLLALTEQEIGMGQFLEAQKNLIILKKMTLTSDTEQLNQLEWLTYLMFRGKTYNTKINTSKRIEYLRQLREMAEKLANKPLKPAQLASLAQDSLSFGKANIALEVYKQMLKNNALHTPDELAEGGSIAMQNNAHHDSAQFYWAAYQKSKKISDQKKYALLAIKALWAGNLVQEALSLTNQLPASLIKDRNTLLYLSRLALAANHPEIAEKYAIEALLLDTNNNHE